VVVSSQRNRIAKIEANPFCDDVGVMAAFHANAVDPSLLDIGRSDLNAAFAIQEL
jgi:hypothetical protein